MPTFLLKRLEVLNTLGEKDSIKVYIYQVIEILQSNNRNDENATKKSDELMTWENEWLVGVTLVFVDATG
jgi:hypothetical protein